MRGAFRDAMRRFVTLILALTILLGAGAMGSVARAQCVSNASSCVSCHEVQGLRPVLQSVHPWHVDHGFGDLCASCHSGDPAAPQKEAAHTALRRPLDDPSASCAGCHATDLSRRVERYRVALAEAPAAPGGGAIASDATRATKEAGVPTKGSLANRLLALCAVLLGGALFFLSPRGRKVARRPAVEWLRDKSWSPYGAGALLGVVVAFSEVVCGRPIAASGAFDKLAAYLGRWLFPHSQYYAHVMTPGITWQVWLVVGVFVGAFASSKLSGEARARWLPDTQWQERYGPSRMVRLGLAFVGAALVQVGAGIAGGCTSGLAISGGAVMAPAAFLFMAGMFAGGIPTAWLWSRGGKR